MNDGNVQKNYFHVLLAMILKVFNFIKKLFCAKYNEIFSLEENKKQSVFKIINNEHFLISNAENWNLDPIKYCIRLRLLRILPDLYDYISINKYIEFGKFKIIYEIIIDRKVIINFSHDRDMFIDHFNGSISFEKLSYFCDIHIDNLKDKIDLIK